MNKVFLVRGNVDGKSSLQTFFSRVELIDYLELFEQFDWCEIAEVSTAMSTSGNRKETLEWKRPARGGITW